MKQMTRKAEEVGGLLKALSNPKRLLILCRLVDQELSVGDLASRVGARETAVSQQLALLRKDGLVKPRRSGQTIYYRLARSDVAALIGFLYETYCR